MAPSLPLLRSWRSTIYAPSRHESANAVVVNKAVESQASINNRFSEQQQQQHYESSVTELRRRLARKASTFSLRGKNRRSQRYLRELVKAEEANKKAEEKSETSSVKTVTQEGAARGNNNSQGVKETTNSGLSASVGTISSFAAAAAAATHKTRQNVPHPQQQREHTSVSMASSTSEPPVPFERLQTIATEACDSTLESATSYVHANTADWNTTIINTILQKLVKETTTEQAQPQYKYIVNSTIIQHAATGGDGGRRGMHAASGAYWNNEKDGMWSFKYEAAEGKGLDVVVGIIWVWIG